MDDALAVHIAGRAGLGRVGGVQHQPAGTLQRRDVALAKGGGQLGAGLGDGGWLGGGVFGENLVALAVAFRLGGCVAQQRGRR